MKTDEAKPEVSSQDLPAEMAICFNAQLLDSTHIAVKFNTLPGNQPKNFGNVISVWKAGQAWSEPPLATVAVNKDTPNEDTPDGDMIIDLSAVQPPAEPPYLVGYGTSSSGTAYCAVQTLTSDGPSPVVPTQMEVGYIGTNSLFVKFKTPPENSPSANKNWIGLWVGQGANYDGTNQIAKFEVTTTSAQGSQGLNGLRLLFGTRYTLAYACGPRKEDMAAWFIFKTQPYLLYKLRRLFSWTTR